MTVPFLAPLALAVALAALPGAAAEPEETPLQGSVRTEVRVQRLMVVRVPRAPVLPAAMTSARPLPPIQWVEKRGERCVPIQDLAAVSVTRPDSVDILLNGGRRLRAQLADQCPALDFYAGLYLKPTADGKVCADRDVLRSRSGGQCRIERFRALVPAR